MYKKIRALFCDSLEQSEFDEASYPRKVAMLGSFAQIEEGRENTDCFIGYFKFSRHNHEKKIRKIITEFILLKIIDLILLTLLTCLFFVSQHYRLVFLVASILYFKHSATSQRYELEIYLLE